MQFSHGEISSAKSKKTKEQVVAVAAASAAPTTPSAAQDKLGGHAGRGASLNEQTNEIYTLEGFVVDTSQL